jgi:hypothetical protein
LTSVKWGSEARWKDEGDLDESEEATMASSVHFYLSWAKERMDEMDAVVASLEGKASELTAQSRAAADRLIADLREQRDSFLVDMQKRGKEGEAAWIDAKAKMESDWNDFQSNVKKFVDEFGQQFKQPQTTFQEMAAVQLRSWREAAERVQAASAELTADHRAKMEATVAQMKADASTAEARFEKLTKAGAESWTALSAALSDSRAAFDRANQTAWDAFRRASSGT